MANGLFDILIDATGLRNAVVYPFADSGTPLEPEYEDFPAQEARGNQSQRLDTGSQEAQVYSWLGTPVFSDLKLTALNTDGTLSDESAHLLTVILEVRQIKNIDIVSVQGVNGTIKTWVSDGDHEVRIRGILSTDNTTDYPLSDAKNLISILKKNTALACVSDFLQLFGIYNLVVLDYGFPQQEAAQNTQLFDIMALSDTPVELIQDV